MYDERFLGMFPHCQTMINWFLVSSQTFWLFSQWVGLNYNCYTSIKFSDGNLKIISVSRQVNLPKLEPEPLTSCFSYPVVVWLWPKKLSISVTVPPAPVWVPSQKPLAPNVVSVISVANDKGNNEMILGAVHRSPGICLTAEENLLFIYVCYLCTIQVHYPLPVGWYCSHYLHLFMCRLTKHIYSFIWGSSCIEVNITSSIYCIQLL